MATDLRSLWNFGDPAGSEARFCEHLEGAEGEFRLELLTQIARAQGLQRNFEAAHATLDTLPPLPDKPTNRWETLALLERGRTLNSSGRKSEAGPLFDRAAESPIDDLRIDAIHMQAIVAEPGEALALNERAIREAQASSDPAARRWLGSLLNNTAWSYHELGQFDRALELFQGALDFRMAQGDEETIRIASWCVGRCLRSLSRIDEALEIQRRLASGATDGFVDEEIAECLLAKGDAEAAKPYFAKAHSSLSKDPWLSEREPERLARLDRLAR